LIYHSATVISLESVGQATHSQIAVVKEELGNQKDEKTFQEVENWLCPLKLDQAAIHSAALDQHHPGTCQWFLTSSFFQHWLRGKENFAWLNGIRKCFRNAHRCVSAKRRGSWVWENRSFVGPPILY
jgi:hypothetical protein